jgi:indolepyruvate ferredoxin oxidoreductase beta subunit
MLEGVRSMVREFNLVIAGVGGQGVILMAEILGEAATIEGLKVRGSEILGLAVRGGPVSSTIRIGSQVYGPLVPEGKGDVLVGLEPIETLRNITYLSKSGVAVVNTSPIIPYIVSLGLTKYSHIENILEELKERSTSVMALDATKLAQKAGTPAAANMVMLGALAGTGKLPLKNKTLKKIMKTRLSEEVARINIKAFDLGFKVSKNMAKKKLPNIARVKSSANANKRQVLRNQAKAYQAQPG